MAYASSAGNYVYKPSKPAALLFAALFGISLLAHLFQAGRGRTWWMWPLLVATILEVGGYVVRYMAIVHFHTEIYFTIAEVSVVVAPAFLAACLYMMVGRLMSYIGAEFSFIGHSIITKVFVLSDIASIIAQSGCAAILSTSKNASTSKVAKGILIASLVFQVLSLLVFFVFTASFHVRAQRALGSKLSPMRWILAAVYLSTVLIVVRSIYRTIEFASINFGPDAKLTYIDLHEWLFYVFDSVPIFFATMPFNVWHPSSYVPSQKGLRIDGGVEELTGRWWNRKVHIKHVQNASQSSLEMGHYNPYAAS